MAKKNKKETVDGIDAIIMPENMFAHFGLPNADVLKARSDLKIRLRKTIAERHLTQAQVARLLGVSQPHVSSIMSGKLKKASMESLMCYLNKLGIEINIQARTKTSKVPARTLLAAE